MANPKFRLKDIEVRKLGLIPTAINRFRLNPQQQRQLSKIREGQSDIKRLFFDIETSPNIGYFWRTGYNLSITPDCIINERKIICISYKWETEDKIYSLT